MNDANAYKRHISDISNYMSACGCIKNVTIYTEVLFLCRQIAEMHKSDASQFFLWYQSRKILFKRIGVNYYITNICYAVSKPGDCIRLLDKGGEIAGSHLHFKHIKIMELIKMFESKTVTIKIWSLFLAGGKSDKNRMEASIHFLNGNTPAIQQYYAQKGYRDDVIIEIDQLFYEVYFYVEGALLHETKKDGVFSVPGLIVLDEISNNKIFNAFDVLIELGYFDSLKGQSTFPANNRFKDKWNQSEEYSFDLNELG